MTWDDYQPIPGIDWADPAQGPNGNFTWPSWRSIFPISPS